jgi:uncharacterized protein YciI
MEIDKKYFVLFLNPVRADFAQTLSEEERLIMKQHLDYWKEYMGQGKVIIFGPVLDREGVYGLGVVAVDDEQEVQDLIANDPASKINNYEYFPIRAVVPQTKNDSSGLG